MKPSFMRAAGTRNPDAATRWLRALLLLGSSSLLLQGCHRDAERRLKNAVLGSWEEVRGTKETLQFNADGTLVMESRSQHRICLTTFPITPISDWIAHPRGHLRVPSYMRFL